METPKWYEREVRLYAEQFCGLLGDKYQPYTTSNDGRKHVYIYAMEAHDSRWHMSAPTWYDLYVAIQAAWNLRTLVKRGF